MTLLRLLHFASSYLPVAQVLRFGGRNSRRGRISLLLSTGSQLPKLNVAGSIPVSRSMFSASYSHLVQRPAPLCSRFSSGGP